MPTMVVLDYVASGTLLNLAAVARMMLADGKVTPEESEVFEALLSECKLDLDTRFEVEGWGWQAPSDDTLADLAQDVDEEGLREALAVAWVTALSDGDVDPTEEETLAAMARVYGVSGEEGPIREDVEAAFYGGTLTILAAAAAMVDAGGADVDEETKRAHLASVLGAADLPDELAAGARELIVRLRPVGDLLDEARGLSPADRETLVGTLWATAWADGVVVDAEQALYERFLEVCDLPEERVHELQAEWGPDEQPTAG